MVDFGFPELNEVESQNEYTISKSKPVNLHLARMPDNFKVHLGTDSAAREATRIDRDLIIKKQKLTDTDSKEIFQYVLEDKDEPKKAGDHGNTVRYIGREVTQNQKFLVFYRKDKDIRLCSLSSIISFKKDQQLRSSALESIKGKRGGRQQGIKALLRTTAKKDEEKEKEKEKEAGNKEKEDDDDVSKKSWSDNEESESDENTNVSDNKDKDKKKSMQIKNIFYEEPPAVEASKKNVQKDNKEKGASAKVTAEKEASDHQSADAKDSENESDSSFDFEL